MTSPTAAPAVRSIPFGRPRLGPEERDAVMEVLSQPILTHGPLVKEFEAAFASYTSAPHAVATSTCTAALHLSYLFIGLGPGDEVIVPAMTHVATAHAVELCGARCVFVDAEPSTGNIDPQHVAAAVTERTRAISVVHFLGLPVDMRPIMAIAVRHGLLVVEDCALAMGATIDGRHVGMHGDVGCFSFYPVKHITTAEGGMLITRRSDLARAAATQRAFGIDRNVVDERPIPGDYDVTCLGNNYRLNEIAAAIGLEQMKRLPEFLAARRANHETLGRGLAEIDEIELLRGSHDGRESACYGLSVLIREPLVARRLELILALRERGVGTSIYYPRPVPHLRYYRDRYGAADKAFPVASRLSARSITLPVGPHLDEGDLQHIIASVKDAIVAVR